MNEASSQYEPAPVFLDNEAGYSQYSEQGCGVAVGDSVPRTKVVLFREADFLRDGIDEVRVGLQGMNYRMLYFFHGKNAVVVSHGLTKEDKVPKKEIELALRRKKAFEVSPKKHTATE